jgi:PTS system mannose-specific IIA component
VIGVLVLTHGNLARELVAAAAVIAGKQPPCEALPLDWGDNLDVAREKVGEAIARLETGEGVLILTDLVGDTPYHAARGYLASGRVEVVTGVNLPMVLRLSCLPSPGALPESGGLARVAQWIRQKGQNSICLAAELAEPTSGVFKRPPLTPDPPVSR